MPLPHSHVVTHDWSDQGRPQLASIILAIAGQPLPELAPKIARPWTVSAHAPCSFPSNVGQPVARVNTISAGDILFDSDFQDLVLAIAAKLKKTISLSQNFRRGMESFLPYFVSTCVSRCFSNATSHDNAWIALPKYSAHIPDLAHLTNNYVRVALVVTLPLPHISHVDQLPASPDSELSDSESERGESVQPYSTLSEMLAQETWVEEPVERYDWKDIPIAPKGPAMQRVVFAADSPVPALSVVVVAEHDTICLAMSSALYHRLAWNTRTPLLGLSFSHDSSVVNLHVGWLDGATEGPNDIPRVHLMGPGMNIARLHMGRGTADLSFHLDNPNDALVLARILLSLQEFIKDDCQKAQVVQQDAILHWRADQELPPAVSTHAWSKETISNWSKSVVSTVDPNVPSFFCDDDGGPPIGRPTAYTFDQFVALKERNGFSPTAVSLWLLDRFVVFYPLPPIAASYDLKTFSFLNDRFKAQIPIFNLYRTATSFKWPRAWQNPRDMPAVPHSLLGMKCELICAIKSGGNQSSNCAMGVPLSQEADLNLEQELFTILQVCALARSLNEVSSTQPYSHCYDMLFSILPTRDRVQLLPSVTIRLSRNTVLDRLAKSPKDPALSKVQTIYHEHFSLQSAETQLFQDRDRKRYYLLRSALQRFGNDTADWPTDWTVVHERVLQAPASGTCDTAIAARFRFRRRLDMAEIPTPSIVIGHSQGYTCPVFPIPYRSTPEPFTGYTATQRTLTYNIMATAHHDYPTSSTPALDMDMEENSIYTAAEVSANGSSTRTLQEPTHLPERALDIPVLFVVHSAQRVRFHIADSNRLRMCLTSSVQFLASMQIFNFPLFGLLTEGTLCAVIMAWCSQPDEGEPLVHIVDLNCTSYDISIPAGAFNLATFLHWLHYEHVPQLLARLDEVHARGDCPAKHGDDDGRMWTVEDQLRQLERGDSPFDQIDQLRDEDSG